ncbi:MAG: hypothetical protein IJZ62_00965 [Clostridia bacterium]|nr:hypothetical protein [Clostridia bacterium]
MKYNDTIAIRNSLSTICCKQDIKILKPCHNFKFDADQTEGFLLKI